MSTSNRKTASDNQWPFIRYAEKEQKWMVDSRTKDGGSRRFFGTKIEAQTFAQQCRVARENSGTSIFGNADLARYGKTVGDAIAFYLAYLRRQEKSVTVNEAVASYMEHAEKNKGLSSRYAADLRVRLAKFAQAFGAQQIGAIESEAIVEWLEALPVAMGTRNTFRRRIAALFSFAKQKKWRADNPFTGGKKADIAVAKETRKKVRVLTVEESAKLLEVASDETRAFWAIALFAGLRPESEINRLRWEHVHLAERILIVDGDESETEETKTGRRVVKLHDNLIEWLRPIARPSGAVAPTGNLWKKLRADKRKVGFGTPGTETDAERNAGVKLRRWVEDITRHTFISNHLAESDDIGVTSTQAGNSPSMVRKHYLSLIRPADAAKFWTLAPAKSGKIITMKAA
jgi:integrase